MTDHGDQDMSWVESGYISHPATVNPFPIDGEDFNTHDQSLYDSSAVYEGDDTIRVRIKAFQPNFALYK